MPPHGEGYFRNARFVDHERGAARAPTTHSWQYSQDTTHDDECLDPQECGEPDGEELVERTSGAQSDAQARTDKDQESHQNRRGAGKPELLTDRRKDEIGFHNRDPVRFTLAQPRPCESTVGKCE